MHEHISPLLGEHPRIVNIFLGPVTVHYREVSLYIELDGGRQAGGEGGGGREQGAGGGGR